MRAGLVGLVQAALGLSLAAVLACSRTPTRATPPAARALEADASKGVGAPPPIGELVLKAASAPLEIRRLEPKAFARATAHLSEDRAYALYVEHELFRVEALTGTPKVVVRGKGRGAQWVSPTEVAFVHEDHVRKVDVTTTHRTVGPRACCPTTGCGALFNCGASREPRFTFFSAALDHAIATEAPLAPSLADFRPDGMVDVFAPTTTPYAGETPLAHATSRAGAACMFAGARRPGRFETDGDAGPSPRAAGLFCATPAWTPPRKVRGFTTNDWLDEAELAFVDETEVLVSWSEPTASERPTGETTYRHCLVELAAGAARCTNAPRRRWLLARGTRFALEWNLPPRRPPVLVDLASMREWTLADPARGVWSQPAVDAFAPQRLVMTRLDKGEFSFGELTLPRE